MFCFDTNNRQEFIIPVDEDFKMIHNDIKSFIPETLNCTVLYYNLVNIYTCCVDNDVLELDQYISFMLTLICFAILCLK